MTKEAPAVIGVEGAKALGNGGLKFGEGSGGGLAQVGLELGKGQLDRVQIRTVGRQVMDLGPADGDQFADPRHLVGREVVEDDHVTRTQLRAEDLLKIGGENITIESSLDQKGSRDGFQAQCRQKGGALPVAVRNGGDTALAHRRAPIEPGHLGVEPGFVDEDQAARIPARLFLPPSGAGRLNVGPILLGGARRFFYSSGPTGRCDATGR
jgi:hypothetical protein